MSLRKVASVLVGLGLVIGLMGAGIGAQFTDSATATATINVGTFGIVITTTTGTVVGKTVTCTAGTLTSSAAGTLPCNFTVSNSGTIPATVTVTAVITGQNAAPATQFTDLLVNPGSVSAPHTFNGGLSWAELVNQNLGQSVTITYTISATG